MVMMHYKINKALRNSEKILSLNMRTTVYIFASLTLFLTSLGIVVAPAWFRMTDYDNLFGRSIQIRKGLWLKCLRMGPGQHECDSYQDSVQNQPASLLFCRCV